MGGGHAVDPVEPLSIGDAAVREGGREGIWAGERGMGGREGYGQVRGVWAGEGREARSVQMTPAALESSRAPRGR